MSACGKGLALECVGLGDFAQVGSGGEGLLAGAGEDYGADRRIARDDEEDALEIIKQGTVEGVQHLGPVEGDDGYGVFGFVMKIFVAHR